MRYHKTIAFSSGDDFCSHAAVMQDLYISWNGLICLIN